MASSNLEVKESGGTLRVQTPGPHLVSMGSGRLSTAVTLHPLSEGENSHLHMNNDRIIMLIKIIIN